MPWGVRGKLGLTFVRFVCLGMLLRSQTGSAVQSSSPDKSRIKYSAPVRPPNTLILSYLWLPWLLWSWWVFKKTFSVSLVEINDNMTPSLLVRQINIPEQFLWTLLLPGWWNKPPPSLAAELPSKLTLPPSKTWGSWWTAEADRCGIIETAKDLEYDPIFQGSLQENGLAVSNPTGAYYGEPLDTKEITQVGRAALAISNKR